MGRGRQCRPLTVPPDSLTTWWWYSPPYTAQNAIAAKGLPTGRTAPAARPGTMMQRTKTQEKMAVAWSAVTQLTDHPEWLIKAVNCGSPATTKILNVL